MDALNQKTQGLEHTVGELADQINKSIIGPSGDQGGFVSWSVNCRGTLWTIN
jgi:hypothetical protein